MKINSQVSKFLTNKWVLNIVALLTLLNVIGYMVMGNFNNVIFFILLAVLVRYFSKNMIIVLGIPLIVVNLFSLKNNSYYRIEGMENNTNSNQSHNETIQKINDNKQKKETPVLPGTELEPTDVGASNVKTDEHFEVGRAKNGGSKIDYASTIESAYDELNKILGSDGIKNLTDDTQRLMSQQMQLAESMKGLTPMIEKMMPMAQQMQGMMNGMNGSGGMSNLMEMAQKMAKGLGSANKTA
jgi:hypothetical protein